MTPRQAYKKKDYSLVVPVKDWDRMSGEGHELFIDLQPTDSSEQETVFGIPKERYYLAKKAAEFQSFYKLNTEESEFAFDLSLKKEYPLDAAFEYVYDYVWQYIDGTDLQEGRDSRLMCDLSDEDVLYMYFSCGFGFDTIWELLRKIRKIKKALLNELLANDPVKFETCRNAVSKFEQIRKNDAAYLVGVLAVDAMEDLAEYDELYNYYLLNKKHRPTTSYDFLSFLKRLNYDRYTYEERRARYIAVREFYRGNRSAEEVLERAKHKYGRRNRRFNQENKHAFDMEKAALIQEQQLYEQEVEMYQEQLAREREYDEPDLSFFGSWEYQAWDDRDDEAYYDEQNSDYDEYEWEEDNYLSYEPDDAYLEDIYNEEYFEQEMRDADLSEEDYEKYCEQLEQIDKIREKWEDKKLHKASSLNIDSMKCQ